MQLAKNLNILPPGGTNTDKQNNSANLLTILSFAISVERRTANFESKVGTTKKGWEKFWKKRQVVSFEHLEIFEEEKMISHDQ